MESATDILLLPLLLTFFGALVFGLTVDAGLKKGRLAPSRYVGIALIALALMAGFKDAWMLVDGFNRSALAAVGKKVLYAHYLAGLVPFIALLICIVIDAVSRRRISKLEPL